MNEIKKMSAYQKLKAKNNELIQEIIQLVDKPNDMKTLEVWVKWRMIIDTERVIWRTYKAHGH